MTDRISSQYAHATIKCCGEGCRTSMACSPRAVILKGELAKSAGARKMCGCIIFRNDTRIVPVELKHKNIEPRSMHEKLLNGACEAMRIWSRATSKRPSLHFVAAAKSFADHTAYVRTSRDRIKIRNDMHAIHTAKCGSNIAEIVRDYK